MKASLHIQTGLRNGITYLQGAFYTPPFKVADITENRQSPTLQLMLMSASPGVLDGDVYELRFNIAAGCSVQVHTQSYQRLFTMKGSAAQQMEVRLEEGASLFFLPHPVVPHRGADFSVVNSIYLETGCVLCWGEVLTCGRKLNGEVFQYTRYHNRTSIYQRNKLVIRENLLMEPGTTPVNGIGGLEGFTHQASLVYLDEQLPVPAMLTFIHSWLQEQPGIVYGASAAPVNGVVIRLLGNKAEQLHTCLTNLADLLHCREVAHGSTMHNSTAVSQTH